MGVVGSISTGIEACSSEDEPREEVEEDALAEEKPTSLSVTQEIAPPTAADVLEVFQHFQASILDRIDERDEHVLRALRGILSNVLEQYQRTQARTDDHERRLQGLEKLYNELASEIMAIKLKTKR